MLRLKILIEETELWKLYQHTQDNNDVSYILLEWLENEFQVLPASLGHFATNIKKKLGGPLMLPCLHFDRDTEKKVFQ